MTCLPSSRLLIVFGINLTNLRTRCANKKVRCSRSYFGSFSPVSTSCSWNLVLGSWFLVLWFLVLGSLVLGSWFLEFLPLPRLGLQRLARAARLERNDALHLLLMPSEFGPGRRVAFDQAVADDDLPIRIGGDVGVVGHHNNRLAAFLVDLLKFPENLVAGMGIEVPGRF